MVTYALPPEKLSAELEKRLAQLRSESQKDPRRFSEEMCGEFRKSRAEIERKLSEIRNTRTKAAVQDLLSACAKPSVEVFEALIRKAAAAEAKTCKVSVFQNEPVSFKRVSPNKWVANIGPQGICSAVYLYTMENDPKHTNLWKWSQVRTYADRSGELCKDMQINYKLEYSWQGDDPDMHCETVSFGF
jgi:hypothetical protein